jgi:hypothetical protein
MMIGGGTFLNSCRLYLIFYCVICVYISTFQKKYSECKKFRWALPTYLDHLVEMFHGTTIDGRSSCVPGQSAKPEEPTDTNFWDDEDDDASLKSPKSTGSKKRGSSTTDTASSPHKKHKSPMLKCMKNFMDHIQNGGSKDVDVARQIASMKKEEKRLEEQKVEQR